MKNKAFVIAAAFIVLSSCDKTESYSDVEQFVIYADRENIQSTKTEIKDGTSVVWKQGDAISLFVDSGTGGYKLVSKNSESSSSTVFEGKVGKIVSRTFWAVYPYDESNECNGDFVEVTLPSTQVAKAGSFGDDLFISVAKSSTDHMEFFNVCGGIKFKVDCDNIREVVISNNDGGRMSGKMRVTLDDGGKPKVESISDGGPLRVIAPYGETFTRGENYYAVIPPITFSEGVTIKYITTKGQESSPMAVPSSTIDRSVFSRLPDIGTPTKFTYCPYLTFVSAGESSVFFNNSDAKFEYSYDGVKWEKVVIYDTNLKLTRRCPQFFLRGINSDIGKYQRGVKKIFVSGDHIACYGNVMKLLDYREDITTASEDCFCSLFVDCKHLDHAPELPATDLSDCCYDGMFSGCTSLTSAPKLPATNLADRCYRSMFSGCTSLTSAPELPATALSDWCYAYMFSGCTSLTSATELPVTSLAVACYRGMFSDCTSLTSAPELPATDLSDWCYAYMFSGCTSLTSAPELPATKLAEYCYANMFSGCTSLTSAPELPATSLAGACYDGMFGGCTSLTSAPELPATSLNYSCYRGMFSDCTSLTSAPKLPATYMVDDCYGNMFSGCTSLTSAPELPATNLDWGCYSGMFSDCINLTTAPLLPARYLDYRCYSNMFNGCSKLRSVTALLRVVDNIPSALEGWLSGVSPTGTFYKYATWENRGVIPEGWDVVLVAE